MEYIDFRASSLGDSVDCSRRRAARDLRRQIEAYGHVLAKGRNSAAASMGTALHSMVAELFRAKLAFGEIGAAEIEEALEKVFEDFIKSAEADDVIFDKTTPQEVTARAQLRAMGEAFLPVIELTNPARIEHAFEYMVSPLGKLATPVKLTGHVDVIDTRGEIHDHKTGNEFPSAHAQMGAYSILAKFNGETIHNVRINFVKRQGITKLHEMVCRSVRLPVDECEKAAWSAIADHQRRFEEWVKTGDPWSFPANPMSMVCTKNYCPAFDTSFCRVGCVDGA